ncbi:unnamed protein product [Lactuca virosa]|uniref:Zinc finger GRF-type domain-containing protein n=1 Tax=Lactuca virosa TaxID=75947 RepID=A0AAU9P8A3_9ASTR|nr:unnamed protein product [Lactuca virosa]
MASSSSTSRMLRLRGSNDDDVNNPPEYDCEKPSLQRTSWRIGNPGRRFFNCRNSLTKLMNATSLSG